MVTQNSQECCHALKVHDHFSGAEGQPHQLRWGRKLGIKNIFCQHRAYGWRCFEYGSKGRDLIGSLHLEIRKISSNWTCCLPAKTARISSPIVSCIIFFFQSHFHWDLRRLLRQNRPFVLGQKTCFFLFFKLLLISRSLQTALQPCALSTRLAVFL